MPKKRLLIVTHVFAPSNHSNAKRPHLMAKYFVERGWDVTVLTSSFQVVGGFNEVQDIDGIRVICLRSWTTNLLEWLRKIPWVRSKLMSLFQSLIFPDGFAPWFCAVGRKIKNIEFDVAILNILPTSGLLLAQQGVLDERWVIDYQESVYPFLKRRPRTSPFQRALTPKLLQIEGKALRSCAGAWFSSEANRRYYIKDGLIEDSRTAHLPYFYDPMLYPQPRTSANSDNESILRIMYGGLLNWHWRSPETFFRAWHAFLAACPVAKSRIEFVLFGRMDEQCWELAKELEIADHIDQRPPVGYTEFLSEISHADLLLYIDAKDQEFFNPSKVADYFGTRRPILAFSAVDSDVSKMLHECGMQELLADVNETDRGTQNLLHFWNRWCEGKSMTFETDAYAVSTVCAEAEAWLKARMQLVR